MVASGRPPCTPGTVIASLPLRSTPVVTSPSDQRMRGRTSMLLPAIPATAMLAPCSPIEPQSTSGLGSASQFDLGVDAACHVGAWQMPWRIWMTRRGGRSSRGFTGEAHAAPPG